MQTFWFLAPSYRIVADVLTSITTRRSVGALSSHLTDVEALRAAGRPDVPSK